MTFDLAQMISDREAGTPGDKWCILNWQIAKDDQVRADMRRENNVPLFEAEIIRLTARVEWLEGALNGMLQSVCGPTGFAEAVRHNSGHAYPWHSLDDAEAKARAALSTHTEEPKT